MSKDQRELKPAVARFVDDDNAYIQKHQKEKLHELKLFRESVEYAILKSMKLNANKIYEILHERVGEYCPAIIKLHKETGIDISDVGRYAVGSVGVARVCNNIPNVLINPDGFIELVKNGATAEQFFNIESLCAKEVLQYPVEAAGFLKSGLLTYKDFSSMYDSSGNGYVEECKAYVGEFLKESAKVEEFVGLGVPIKSLIKLLDDQYNPDKKSTTEVTFANVVAGKCEEWVQNEINKKNKGASGAEVDVTKVAPVQQQAGKIVS